jgi:hypothetical protein
MTGWAAGFSNELRETSAALPPKAGLGPDGQKTDEEEGYDAGYDVPEEEFGEKFPAGFGDAVELGEFGGGVLPVLVFGNGCLFHGRKPL